MSRCKDAHRVVGPPIGDGDHCYDCGVSMADLQRVAQRCATCRWWELTKTWSDERGAEVVVSLTTGSCSAIAGADMVDEREAPAGRAVAHDGCCGPGLVYTHADFGCVLWEAKP